VCADNVTQILEEARHNSSTAKHEIKPIPRNGTWEFDWQGNVLPPPRGNSTVDPSTYINTTAYQLCVNAKNCVPVHHARGWRPSFALGYNTTHPYGNGTSSRWLQETHNNSISTAGLRKRQSSGSPGNLAVSASSNSLFYGTQNPSTAVNYAYYICSQTGCSNSQATLSSSYVNNGAWSSPASMTIYTSASGAYPTYNMRDFLIGAAVVAAGQGQNWWSESWNIPHNGGSGTMWVGNGMDDFSVSLYSGAYMEGWMHISITAQNSQYGSSSCSYAVTAVTDALWAFASLFGGLVASVAQFACYV
jgi:hypothetical protein